MALKPQPVIAGTFGTAPDADDAPKEPNQPGSSGGHAEVAAPASNPETPPSAPSAPRPNGATNKDDGAGSVNADEKAPTQPPGTPQLLQQAPPTSAATLEARRSRGARKAKDPARGTRRPGAPWARAAVQESALSAKLEPGSWGPAPVRISKDVKRRLDQRKARDYALYRTKYNLNHYENAAILALPNDLDEIVELARAYLVRLGLKSHDGVGSTGRLHEDARERLNWLTTQLPAHPDAQYGMVTYIQTEALVRLLDALDAEDIEPRSATAVDLDQPL